MSQPDPGNRNPSLRRVEIRRGDASPSLNESRVGPEPPRIEILRDARPPNLRPPPQVHISSENVHYHAPTEEGRDRPTYTEKAEYAFVRPRRSKRKPRNRLHRAYELNDDDDLVEGQDGCEDRMPEIHQTYQRPHSRPAPQSTAFTFAEVHLSNDSAQAGQAQDAQEAISSSGGSSGRGGGGDIQLSAVRDAVPDSKTLNSIMVVVYRSSRRRFDSKRIWLVKKEYRRDERQLYHHQLRTDAAFFEEVRRRYKDELRGTFRRFVSFKTVSTARILEYGNNRFGLADINEKMFSPVFMAAYNDPDASLIRDHPRDWILWLRKIRSRRVHNDRVDLAIELLEDYDPVRVISTIAVALTIFFTLTIVWLAKGGDPAYVAGVMSFVLTIIAAIVGLTGLWDWLDLGHMGGGKDFLILDRKDFDKIDKDGTDWNRPGRQFYSTR